MKRNVDDLIESAAKDIVRQAPFMLSDKVNGLMVIDILRRAGQAFAEIRSAAAAWTSAVNSIVGGSTALSVEVSDGAGLWDTLKAAMEGANGRLASLTSEQQVAVSMAHSNLSWAIRGAERVATEIDTMRASMS